MVDPAGPRETQASTVGVYLDSSAIETAASRLSLLAARTEELRTRIGAVSQPLPAGADEVSVAGAEALGARTSRILDALTEFHGKVLDDSQRLQRVNAEYNDTDASNAKRFERAMHG